MDTIGRDTFLNVYAEAPPWEIGRQQKVFAALGGQLRGSLLDAGCGTGENALFFAQQGLAVTGVDFIDAPIEIAREKAAERSLAATFLVKDALTFQTWEPRFDNAIDSGLFHVFSDADRARYVAGLANVVEPGGRLFLLCFSERTPGDQGPRRVTERELRASFADGWRVDALDPARFDNRPEFRNSLFADEEPWGWFLSATRARA